MEGLLRTGLLSDLMFSFPSADSCKVTFDGTIAQVRASMVEIVEFTAGTK